MASRHKKRTRKQAQLHVGNDGMTSSDEGDDARELAAAVAAGVVGRKDTRRGGRWQYNEAGLLRCLDDIKRVGLAWVETLDVTAPAVPGVSRVGGQDKEGVPKVAQQTCSTVLSSLAANPDDDLKREVAFYNLALSNVKTARAKLDTLGEPHRRPDDYFAEMLKSDTHMQRVKDKLIFEQKKMAAVEQRKREKEQRQYAKQVQAEKLREKASARKASSSALKALTKRKHSRGGMIDDAEVEAIINGRGGGASGGRGSRGNNGKDEKKSWRRKRKDVRYGAGGKKRGAKRNDRDSASQSYKDFSLRQNRAGTGRDLRGGRKKGKTNRPGKRRRLAARASRA